MAPNATRTGSPPPVAGAAGPVHMRGGRMELHAGDCRDVLRGMPDNSVDSVVTDPPYALVSIVKRFGKPGAAPASGNDAYMRASAGFMGKDWDTGETAFAVEFWAEVLRVLKPGGHVVSFSGTRSYHRLAVAIEDAGFEIRDQLAWVYGSGFPKSHDVSKAIDKAAGVEREVLSRRSAHDIRGGKLMEATLGGNLGSYQIDITAPATPQAAAWQGWGTALKPAWEPIVLARKPPSVPVDDIRDADHPVRWRNATVANNVLTHGTGALNVDGCRIEGRYRTEYGLENSKRTRGSVFSEPSPSANFDSRKGRWPTNILYDGSDEVVDTFPDGATRFFYSPKADKQDRIGSKHPTVKPVDLMQWLCRLVTPPGGIVLDPFAGSGSTGEAALQEGFRAILVEREAEYQADIVKRIEMMDAGPVTRKAAARRRTEAPGPLFGDNNNARPPGAETTDRANRTQAVR